MYLVYLIYRYSYSPLNSYFDLFEVFNKNNIMLKNITFTDLYFSI